jgi:hypothetical protein
MNTGDLLVKDPSAASWPKGIDWTDYLAEISASETISTSAWTISGADSSLANAADSIVTGSKKTQIKLSGGTTGVRYTVTNQIVTSSSITDERSFYVLVQDR